MENTPLNSNKLRVFRMLEHAPVGIITFNSDGKIDFVNSVFSKLSKYYHLQTKPLSGTNILENEIIPGFSIADQLTDLSKGYSFEKEITNLKTSDHAEISLVIKGSPVFEKGIYTGGILVIEDLKVAAEAHADELINLNKLQNIFENLADLLFIIDKDGFIKYSAGKKIKLLTDENRKDEDTRITDLIPDLPLFPDTIENMLSSKEEKHFDVKMILGKKHTFYRCTIGPVNPENGHNKFLICSFADISMLKNYEAQIDKLKLFEAVSQITADAVFALNYDGRIILWSKSSELFTGLKEEEISGKPFWDFIPSYNESSFIILKQELTQTKLLRRKIILKDKNNLPLTVDSSFMLSDNGNSILVACSQLKEKQAPDFKSLDENFRDLVSAAQAVVIRLSPTGKIQYVNPAFSKLLGYTEKEVLEKDFAEIIDKNYLKNHPFNLTAFTEKNKTYEISLTSKRKEVAHLIGDFSSTYTGDILTGFIINLIDFSERKKNESDLLTYKLFFDKSVDGITIYHNGKIVSSNNSFTKLFGFDTEYELIGKDIIDFSSADDVLKVAEYLQFKTSGKDGGNRFEFIAKRKDGSSFSCEITVSSFKNEGNIYLILIARDVTERKKAQQTIRESEEKYRNLIENIDDFLYTFEKEKTSFRSAFFTLSVSKITEYSRNEMMMDSKMMFRLIHPDDFSLVKENLRNLIKSRIKNTSEFEFRIINKHGNIVWVRNKLSVIRNERGEAEKFYGLVSDITLRKKAEEELKKSTDNLIKLNETKDKFISIISHDLRTPFSSILGFTDLLINDDTLTQEERAQYIKFIQESSASMLSLVNSILDWTRLQTGRIQFEPERIEASEIINTSINSLHGAAIQKNIKILSNVSNDIFIYADKSLIGQVFNNLISNAIKFTNPGGEIIISAFPSEKSRFYSFSVKDSGIGIKSEDINKLFGVDTKFTMEGTAGEKGSGLGLSLVKEIIEKHGGTIKVESIYGRGSDFIFTLPVTAANILLIDPNVTERVLYTKILKHITPDYNIETASNGSEALQKISDSPYALIISEHIMPVLGGYDFIVELKKAELKIKPPVIVLSGKIDRQTIDDYHKLGIENVFQKPVNLITFKDAVEKCLSQSR